VKGQVQLPCGKRRGDGLGDLLRDALRNKTKTKTESLPGQFLSDQVCPEPVLANENRVRFIVRYKLAPF
jgi:hypothetical protein